MNIKRFKGYYPSPKTKLKYPAFSTIKACVGSSHGLMKWSAKEAAKGVFLEFLKGTINKDTLLRNIEQLGIDSYEREGGASRDFGSQVHAGIEKHLGKEVVIANPLTEDEQIAVNTFKEFQEAVGFKPDDIEVGVVSEKYRFAGRADLTVDFTEEQCDAIKPYLVRGHIMTPGLKIGDYKTGSYYKGDHIMQEGAYAQAYEESYGRKPNGGFVVHIPKDDPKTLKVYCYSEAELREGFEVGFLGAYQYWLYSTAPKWFKEQFV